MIPFLFGVLTLANTPQAKKRARQAEKRRQQNASQRSSMRTSLKRVTKAITEKKSDLAKTEYQLMVSMVDGMVSKGLIHKNKAARHKSRFNAHIKSIAS
jgi:small subunit ribosomal protein S20